MKSFSLPRGLNLFIALAAFGCAKSTFSGSKTNAPPVVAQTKVGPPVAPTGTSSNQSPVVVKDATFDLSCDAELASAFSVKATAGAPGHFLDVSPTCSSVRSTTSSKPVAEALDLVFVVDVTSSMEANISSIRTNLQRFVSKLVERGWDARFAAIAYRDTGENVPPPIPFGTGSQMSSGLNSWRAEGGGDDYQEGSQDAMAQAVKLYQSSGRPAARKVVLLVSDEIGYAMSETGSSGPHNDFSITKLAAKLKFAGVGDLKLYCSVPARSSATPIFSPTSQCNDLRTDSGIGGENIGFPLSESVLLDQFATKFQVVNSNEELSCRLHSVTMEGAAAPAKLGNGVQRLTLGSSAEMAASTGKIVEVKRCCSVLAAGVNGVLESAMCSDPVTRRVTLGVEK